MVPIIQVHPKFNVGLSVMVQNLSIYRFYNDDSIMNTYKNMLAYLFISVFKIHEILPFSYS